ncbi:hypothetical protein Pmani_030969 [Petrolisthes manimaculis]|uniref:Uncharacterized protein n=1 Tax=Petrolisthes manimaculis TaxID=1843537 RepID=A0AAE1NUJ7_9EUCA|nr:hypothetical protein Pmani_030969 [Petrolisthes manimaculis]
MEAWRAQNHNQREGRGGGGGGCNPQGQPLSNLHTTLILLPVHPRQQGGNVIGNIATPSRLDRQTKQQSTCAFRREEGRRGRWGMKAIHPNKKSKKLKASKTGKQREMVI